jgi:hypothetical protein
MNTDKILSWLLLLMYALAVGLAAYTAYEWVH